MKSETHEYQYNVYRVQMTTAVNRKSFAVYTKLQQLKRNMADCFVYLTPFRHTESQC